MPLEAGSGRPACASGSPPGRPELTGKRLLREMIRKLGYEGGGVLTGFLREARPPRPKPFERRFETAPGRQGRAGFAPFRTAFTDEPRVARIRFHARPAPLLVTGSAARRSPPAAPACSSSW